MRTIHKNVKNAKNEPKMAKFQNNHRFSGSKRPQKMIQWAETAKNGFKCFKMHSNAYSPKRAQKLQKW